MDLELAFLNTVIAFKLMAYSYSLKSFFKDDFKRGEHNNIYYVIPFSHIVFAKRHIFPMIRDCCDFVCPYKDQCDGHKFLNFVQKLYEFQHHAVIDEKCFYPNFHFYNFKLKKDKDREKIDGWDFTVMESKDLSHLTYSKRCQYLD